MYGSSETTRPKDLGDGTEASTVRPNNPDDPSITKGFDEGMFEMQE
jgi:hypothetical protein